MSFPDPYNNGDAAGGVFWQQTPPINQLQQPEFSNSHQFDQPSSQAFKRLRNNIIINNNNNLENTLQMNASLSLSPSLSVPFPPLPNSRVNSGIQNIPSGKGTSHIFYKTRMCAKFMEGSCRNGEHCTFAHGSEDLREPPPNWQDLVREMERGGPGGGGGGIDDPKTLMQRMKICKKFYNGEECPYGDKCNFFHERGPQFKSCVGKDQSRESSVISIGTTGSAAMVARKSCADLDIINNNNQAKVGSWKTRLCIKYETTGQCPFGDKCHFAHGQSELQALAEEATNVDTMKSMNVGVSDSSSGGKIGHKFKLNKKISGLYADWIDGFIPPHLLPGNANAADI